MTYKALKRILSVTSFKERNQLSKHVGENLDKFHKFVQGSSISSSAEFLRWYFCSGLKHNHIVLRAKDICPNLSNSADLDFQVQYTVE